VQDIIVLKGLLGTLTLFITSTPDI